MDDFVRRYYGEVLEHSGDLRTDACCTAESPLAHMASHFELIGDKATPYGIFPECGTPMPFVADTAPAKNSCC